MPSCEIRCEHCRGWFRSPIQSRTQEAFFFTSTLAGNISTCSHCGKATGCNKENMRFRGDKEEFVGDET